jgi:hypothetical protein
MTRESDDEARRYLLGRLSEDEAAALERAYFGDAARVDDIAAAESDLVDAYLAGELSGHDRAAFESHYLGSPVHRDRLDTATRLRLLAASRRRRTPFLWAGLAAAATVALSVLWWWTTPPPEPRTAEVPSAAPVPSTSVPAVETPAPAPSPAVRTRTVTLALASLRVRGADATPGLRLTSDVDEVALELGADLGATPDAYRYALRTVDGAEVATGPVTAGGRAARHVVRVRASLLAADDYILAVHAGAEGPVAQYFFRITR